MALRRDRQVDPEVEAHLESFLRGLGNPKFDSREMRRTLHEIYEDHMPTQTDPWSAFVAGATYVTASITYPGAFGHRIVRYLFCTTLGALVGLLIAR